MGSSLCNTLAGRCCLDHANPDLRSFALQAKGDAILDGCATLIAAMFH
jgi:hypothetical protein